MRVALVYPPYGPFGVASLGLSILKAGVQQRGYPCDVFYWNIDFLKQLPYKDRKPLYLNMSCQFFFPANEWIFSSVVYPEGTVASKDDMRDLFLGHEEAIRVTRAEETQRGYWKITSDLAERVHEFVDPMVARLAGYDVVGINTTFFQNIPALALAKTVKDRWPDKKIVLGGANCVGVLGETLIQQFEFVDYVFLGESDFSFPEFVDRLATGRDVAGIGGIARREKGVVIVDERRQPVTDLDAIPIPDFTDYVAQYRASGLAGHDEVLLPLESSRGCWWGAKHHCTFCGLNADNLTQRQKSFENFRREVEQVSAQTGVSYFFMTDNIFYWKHLHQFLAWKNETQNNLNFFYEIRPTGSRKQVLDLVRAGITMVQPGIEHFSTKILALMEKHLVGIQNIAFLKFAREYGLSPAYNVLCLFPGEDVQEYHRLAEHLPKVTHLMPPNGLSPVQYHRFSPYFYRPEEYGIRLTPYRGYKYIYPFKAEVLQNLAYIFDLAEPLTEPPSSGHLTDINNVINTWKRTYDEEVCTLTWDTDGSDIVIEDRRRGFPQRSYRLTAGARNVFFALDTPATLESAVIRLRRAEHPHPWEKFVEEFGATVPVRGEGDTPLAEFLYELEARRSGDITAEAVTIALDQEEFARSPDAAIKPFVEYGLVYEEDGSYLSLPVYKRRAATDAAWRKFDV